MFSTLVFSSCASLPFFNPTSDYGKNKIEKERYLWNKRENKTPPVWRMEGICNSGFNCNLVQLVASSS